LNHPAHKEFGSMAMKVLADVFVLDFTADKDSSTAKTAKGKKEKSSK
jgi:hypothetical protein